MKYGAFLSYSRTASGPLARDLQAGLQRFAKKWNQLRAVDVFRDDSNLSANPNLWGSIVSALSDSRWLVLVATPAAAASRYVDDEVAWWIANRGPDSVLLVHAGGAIGWDREAHRFSSDTDCVPPSLIQAMTVEPRWIDLSWYQGAGLQAAKDPRFAERVADLSCTIQERDRAELVGEDVRQHTTLRRLRTGAIIGLSVLLVTSLIGGVAAVLQGNEATRQRDRASVRQSSALARLLSDSDLQKSLLLAESSHRSLEDADTRAALYEVVNATPQLVQFVEFGAPVAVADATPDSRVVVAGLPDGRVITVDRATGTRTEFGHLNGPISFVAISDDGRTVAASARVEPPAESRRVFLDEAGVWADGAQSVTLDSRLVGLSPDGRTYVTARDKDEEVLGDKLIEQFGPQGHRTYELPGLEPTWMRVHDDGSMAVVNEYGYVLKVTPQGKQIRTRIPMGTWMFGGALSEDLNRFTYTNGGDPIEVWDITSNTGEDTIEAARAGWTPVPDLSGIALDRAGARMVTAANGALFVSDVAPVQQLQRRVTELRGAGASPHSLRFLGESGLLSASGSAVAVWDLSRSGVSVQSVAADIDPPCSACAPNGVAVSPGGSRALVHDPGFLLTDFTTGSTRQLDTPTAIVGALWIDDDSLLLVDGLGRAAVYGGDLSLKQAVTISGAPELQRLTMARRPDGVIVGLGAGALLTFSVDLSEATVRATEATHLTSDGRYLARVRDTRLEVLSTEDLSTEATIDLPQGDEVVRIDANQDRFFFITSNADADAVALATLDTATWRPSDRRPLAVSSAITPLWESASAVGRLANVESTDVALYDLGSGQRLKVATVGSQIRSPRGTGVSSDGNTLVVASVPDGRVIRVELNPASWSAAACDRAGRAATRDDLIQQGIDPGGLTLGCP